MQFNHSRDFYIGKPIIITENNSRLGLANGSDIALYLAEKQPDKVLKNITFENGRG